MVLANEKRYGEAERLPLGSLGNETGLEISPDYPIRLEHSAR
jgi:hypothetical protein